MIEEKQINVCGAGEMNDRIWGCCQGYSSILDQYCKLMFPKDKPIFISSAILWWRWTIKIVWWANIYLIKIFTSLIDKSFSGTERPGLPPNYPSFRVQVALFQAAPFGQLLMATVLSHGMSCGWDQLHQLVSLQGQVPELQQLGRAYLI